MQWSYVFWLLRVKSKGCFFLNDKNWKHYAVLVYSVIASKSRSCLLQFAKLIYNCRNPNKKEKLGLPPLLSFASVFLFYFFKYSVVCLIVFILFSFQLPFPAFYSFRSINAFNIFTILIACMTVIPFTSF